MGHFRPMTARRYFDWSRFHSQEHRVPPMVDSRRRLRWCLAGFVLLAAVVFGRMVQLEVCHGARFRALAARPVARERSVPGTRGRILADNGVVLACDQDVSALAVHYRYLEQPPNARWLRGTARSRLARAERKNSERTAEEETRVTAERVELARRLAGMSGISIETWNARATRIQTRVERIAELVNRRRLAKFEQRHVNSEEAGGSQKTFGSRIRAFALEVLAGSVDESPPERIRVAEELDYHVVVEDLPGEVVDEIEAHAERYPGVKIVRYRRRAYPSGTLAAHLLGHLGPTADTPETGPAEGYHPEDQVGKTGLERQYERILHGPRGLVVDLADHRGHVLSSHPRQEPGIGHDLRLTLDPALQQAAEELLDAALKRRALSQPTWALSQPTSIEAMPATSSPAGGACVVMDVHTGAIRAAASAPSFDPNRFSSRVGRDVESLLSDPARPLFDRVLKMAIPPGSVFKIVTAAALLTDPAPLTDSAPQAESVVRADEPYFCQGYLHSPDRWRCAIFRHRGTGHGNVSLHDALAQSCNVYFFHHAARLGPERLIDWAWRFGFGRPTGIDLPDEAAGTLPLCRSVGRAGTPSWQNDAMALAVGQGELEVTPLQVVRMTAAVANGGRLVTPYLVEPHFGEIVRPAPTPIDRLDAATLASIREGLEHVVSAPQGTGHGTIRLDTVEVAGKTGTAETGATETGTDRGDHAWFAGYVPAENPKLALVVVLEHGGNASEAAGPVAKRLVLAIQRLGYLDERVERPAGLRKM